MAEFLTAPGFPARHGFFTRRGGVSEGPFASLNCSLSSADSRANLASNRAKVAEAMGVAADRLVGVWQVHGREVAMVEQAWPAGEGPKADAMVTRRPGLALGVITADCAPVLFANPEAGVVAAAHAGWRGACDGVLEASLDAMRALGAARGRVVAAIGPCIAQASYEVAADMRDAVLRSFDGAAAFFIDADRAGHWRFDLAGYCAARLAAQGVQVQSLRLDTYADEARFFSHRRRVLTTGGPIGHQISAVVL
jgi:YfiH family protein